MLLSDLSPEWLRWTIPTITFLLTIVSLLTFFTIWDMKDPGWERQGTILPIETTRGDRFFMGLLLTGIMFCLWMYFLGTTAAWMIIVLGVLNIAFTIRYF
jgi:Predicted small integral membrane protein